MGLSPDAFELSRSGHSLVQGTVTGSRDAGTFGVAARRALRIALRDTVDFARPRIKNPDSAIWYSGLCVPAATDPIRWPGQDLASGEAASSASKAAWSTYRR